MKVNYKPLINQTFTVGEVVWLSEHQPGSSLINTTGSWQQASRGLGGSRGAPGQGRLRGMGAGVMGVNR